MPETNTNLSLKYPAFVEKFKSEIVAEEYLRKDLTVIVKPEKIREILTFLKKDASTKFEMLMDLFAMDYLKFRPETPERFAVIYILYSMTTHKHLRIKTYLPESKPEIDSIHDIYKAANWNEREAWDMFGVVFKNHPNLIRILCHNDFVGHPMRKDYPSDGYQRLKNASSSSGF